MWVVEGEVEAAGKAGAETAISAMRYYWVSPLSNFTKGSAMTQMTNAIWRRVSGWLSVASGGYVRVPARVGCGGGLWGGLLRDADRRGLAGGVGKTGAGKSVAVWGPMNSSSLTGTVGRRGETAVIADFQMPDSRMKRLTK